MVPSIPDALHNTQWAEFFPFIRFPDIDHIAEYLHAHIILHFGLVFNKRNKKKRCTIFNMYLFDSVGVAFFGEEGDILLGYVFNILGLNILQTGDAFDITPEELGAEDGFIKDELAAVRQFGVQDGAVFKFVVCVVRGHKLLLSVYTGTDREAENANKRTESLLSG